MKRRCHPILQNLVQLAEALPFDSIFLANQLAGNKRATLAYVPDVDLLHYGFPPCPLSCGGCSLPLLESFHRCCRDPRDRRDFVKRPLARCDAR
jgi:hypothetical protein